MSANEIAIIVLAAWIGASAVVIYTVCAMSSQITRNGVDDEDGEGK